MTTSGPPPTLSPKLAVVGAVRISRAIFASSGSRVILSIESSAASHTGEGTRGAARVCLRGMLETSCCSGEGWIVHTGLHYAHVGSAELRWAEVELSILSDSVHVSSFRLLCLLVYHWAYCRLSGGRLCRLRLPLRICYIRLS